MLRLIVLLALSLFVAFATAQETGNRPATLPEHINVSGADLPNTPENRLLAVLYSKLEYPAVALHNGVDGAVYAIIKVDTEGMAHVAYVRYFTLEGLRAAAPEVPDDRIAVMTGYRPSYGPAPIRTDDPDLLARATASLEGEVQEVFADFPPFEPAMADGVAVDSQFPYLILFTIE